MKETVKNVIIDCLSRYKAEAESLGKMELANKYEKDIICTKWYVWFYYKWELEEVRVRYYKKYIDLIRDNEKELIDILMNSYTNEEAFKKMKDAKISKKLINMFRYFEHLSHLMDIYYFLPDAGYEQFSHEGYFIFSSWRSSKTASEAIEKIKNMKEFSTDEVLINWLRNYEKRFNTMHTTVNDPDFIWRWSAAIEIDVICDPGVIEEYSMYYNLY